MLESISHDRNEESIEAMARWFQSLTIAERMQMLNEFTDLALAINPKIAEVGRVQSSSGRIRVLEIP